VLLLLLLLHVLLCLLLLAESQHRTDHAVYRCSSSYSC
jgi:hypothetical protein